MGGECLTDFQLKRAILQLQIGLALGNDEETAKKN